MKKYKLLNNKTQTDFFDIGHAGQDGESDDDACEKHINLIFLLALQ